MWSYKHILREASACLLVQRIRAIPEPRNVGRATSTALTLFFCTNSIAEEEGPTAAF